MGFGFLLSFVHRAMNKEIQISLKSGFHFFWNIPRGRTAKSKDNSIFNFLRNDRIVCHSAAPFCIPTTNTQEFQFSHILANIYRFLFIGGFFLFLRVAILMGVRCCLTVVLICISLMITTSIQWSVVSDSLWFPGLQLTRLLCPWDFPGKNTGVGCHFLLQGTFPTQGLNLHLMHCRWILYHMSYTEKIFMCIIATFVSSLEKYLYKFSVHFLGGLSSVTVEL